MLKFVTIFSMRFIICVIWDGGKNQDGEGDRDYRVKANGNRDRDVHSELILRTVGA